MKNIFNKFLVFMVFGSSVFAANPIRYVQISTNTVTQQSGTFNVAGGVVGSTFTALSANTPGTGFQVGSSSITTNTATYLKGTSSANEARAGDYGEYISSVTGATRIPNGSGTFFDLAQITLSTGDWDVFGLINENANGVVALRNIIAISSTTGSTGGGIPGDSQYDCAIPLNGVRLAGCPIVLRVLTATTTNFILQNRSDWTLTTTTPTVTGKIWARRAR